MGARVSIEGSSDVRNLGDMGHFLLNGMVVETAGSITRVYFKPPASFRRSGFYLISWQVNRRVVFESRTPGSFMEIDTKGNRYGIETCL